MIAVKAALIRLKVMNMAASAVFDFAEKALIVGNAPFVVKNACTSV